MEIKNWLENIWVCVVKNGCGYSGVWKLKLGVPQERTDFWNELFFGVLIKIQESQKLL